MTSVRVLVVWWWWWAPPHYYHHGSVTPVLALGAGTAPDDPGHGSVTPVRTLLLFGKVWNRWLGFVL